MGQDRSTIEYHPKIRDLPLTDRPRERLIQFGAGMLGNAELLAILLRTGVHGENAVAVAQRLLSQFSGLRGIAGATYGELSAQKGISEAKYCQLMAALELGKRLAALGPDDRVVVRSPGDVVRLLSPEMATLDQEHLRVLLLNTKNHVLAVHRIYVGTVNTSLVRPAEVFRPAIRDNTPGIILVHNHPSGDPTPSSHDIDLTRQLRQAGEVLGVDLLDHIVIGSSGWVSMKDRGLGF